MGHEGGEAPFVGAGPGAQRAYLATAAPARRASSKVGARMIGQTPTAPRAKKREAPIFTGYGNRENNQYVSSIVQSRGARAAQAARAGRRRI